MKKLLSIITLFGILTTLLTGCGTSNSKILKTYDDAFKMLQNADSINSVMQMNTTIRYNGKVDEFIKNENVSEQLKNGVTTAATKESASKMVDVTTALKSYYANGTLYSDENGVKYRKDLEPDKVSALRYLMKFDGKAVKSYRPSKTETGSQIIFTVSGNTLLDPLSSILFDSVPDLDSKGQAISISDVSYIVKINKSGQITDVTASSTFKLDNNNIKKNITLNYSIEFKNINQAYTPVDIDESAYPPLK
ncbi:MAG: hypothetical protein Q8865_00820 [Bacillota bacterium]|nr:hypothetical protein [Bacillota bacterium]